MVHCLSQPLVPSTRVILGPTRRRHRAGRYHATELCWALHGKTRGMTTVFLAAAAGNWPCPYCAAAPPPCCARGEHGGLALPRLEAPEQPDWERELELTEADDDHRPLHA